MRANIKTAPPFKILKLAARRAAPYEASTSIISNILKASGWLTVSGFGTGLLMAQLGLGLVWGWFGLVWPQAHVMESLLFPMDLLGLGLVWLGLAAGACDGIIAFSNGSAWFGVGLAWFGRRRM